MTLIAVARNKYAKGLPSPEAPLAYEQLELVDALTRTYDSDAHLVTYIVDGYAPHQPRVNKETLKLLGNTVTPRTTTFFCDLDNPEHTPWTDESRAAAIAFDRERLPTAGVYHTANGRRIVQPLAEPLHAASSEAYLRRWLIELEALGYTVDWNCRDFTRHFRLAHVRRKGRPFRSPVVDLARMVPVDLAPLDVVPELVPERRARPRREGGGAAVSFTGSIPEAWRAHGAEIAREIQRSVTANWHGMYLALAGALVKAQVPAEYVPAIVRYTASLASSVKPHHHEKSASDTVRRYLDGSSITGFGELLLHFPGVARAVERATSQASREAPARAQIEAPPAVALAPLADTVAAMEEILRVAPDGLTVIAAACGLGKTRAAERIAGERAGRKHLTVVTSSRAPAQSKTSISVDKTELAQQIYGNLVARGIVAKRYFGPLSVQHADGTYECRYHDVAEPLVAGGQSMQWEFCLGRGKQKCEFYEICTAKEGVEGPTDARVTVGTHPLLSELDGAAGATGLLVIDEPPPVLETITFKAADVDEALASISAFEQRFVNAMTPALFAIRDWADPTVLWTDLTDTLDVRNAFPEDAIRHAPPLRRQAIYAARRSLGYALRLGKASTVLGALYRALTEAAAVRLVDDNIVVTLPHERLARALKRDGAVVVTDANAALFVDLYARIVGYQPRLHHFAAVDGAPIERTLLHTRGATRTGWLSHGRVSLATGLVAAIREVFTWAGSSTLAIITYKVVHLLLAGVLAPHDASTTEAWLKAEQPMHVLTEARRDLADLAGRPVLLGHYGATRGLDTMKDVDCIATLGDPRPNLDEVDHEAAFLRVKADDGRVDALARAELEQAHGRLRAIHRQRPGRALHVGALVPGGSAWAAGAVTIVRRESGRPSNVRAMTQVELLELVTGVGGNRAAARRLGCSDATIRRYLSGERAISPAAAADIRSAIGVSGAPGSVFESLGPLVLRGSAPAPETPVKIRSERGFGRTHLDHSTPKDEAG